MLLIESIDHIWTGRLIQFIPVGQPVGWFLYFSEPESGLLLTLSTLHAIFGSGGGNGEMEEMVVRWS